MSTELIRVCAVVFRDTDGRVLSVRKKNTSRFMLPGGKPESGETPRETAVREVREEIGTLIDAATLTHLGTFRTAAANEAGREVEGTIFTCPATVDPVPAAEIAEIRWVDPRNPADAGVDLAPLLETKVFPALG
ncbi:NUDIX domain-containing protein [uncultured Corynebacterium sp.]|uniref:NUDIX hydrolase n=1 Tax=uncultured Corynebacterium sp. TaxID=159447 RepID=UPI00262BCDAB|nr:NUDIX domain-containing protein [uncultured Corynebacterium sp.]